MTFHILIFYYFLNNIFSMTYIWINTIFIEKSI